MTHNTKNESFGFVPSTSKKLKVGDEWWISPEQHYQELQKARAELLEEMNEFTFEACPYEGTMMRAFIRKKQSELDQPTKCEHDVVAKYCFRCKRPDLAGTPPEDIPGFEGTMEALGKLKI